MKIFAGIPSAAVFWCSLLSSVPASAVPLQLLLERDTDADAGSEVFLVTYDSYADLLSNDFSASSFSQLNINANFSAGGLAATVPPVPIPPALWLFGSGLIGLAGIARRKKAA